MKGIIFFLVFPGILDKFIYTPFFQSDLDIRCVSKYRVLYWYL